jgi:hypothetical protein
VKCSLLRTNILNDHRLLTANQFNRNEKMAARTADGWDLSAITIGAGANGLIGIVPLYEGRVGYGGRTYRTLENQLLQRMNSAKLARKNGQPIMRQFRHPRDRAISSEE